MEFYKDKMRFDNGSYYIGNYVSILLNNDTIKNGEIANINVEENYIIFKIYKTKNDYSEIKIKCNEIKAVKLTKWDFKNSQI